MKNLTFNYFSRLYFNIFFQNCKFLSRFFQIIIPISNFALNSPDKSGELFVHSPLPFFYLDKGRSRWNRERGLRRGWGLRLKKRLERAKNFSFARRSPSFKWRRKKRRQPKIFHLSDCIEITDINMLKLSNRIGCNDSSFSQVNQQTESMTEKFFERALFPRLFQLDWGKSRAWGLGTEYPKIQHKKILRPSGTSFQ